MPEVPKDAPVVDNPLPMGAYGEPVMDAQGSGGWMEALTRILIAYAPTVENLAGTFLRGLTARACPNCNPPEGEGGKRARS